MVEAEEVIKMQEAMPPQEDRAGVDAPAAEGKVREARSRTDKQEIRILVQSMFSIAEVPDGGPTKPKQLTWSCRHCSKFMHKYNSTTYQRPLHHILGCAENGQPGQASACSGLTLPITVRNQLRSFYKLPDWAPPPASVSSSSLAVSQHQITLQEASNKALCESLNREVAKWFYSANLPFQLANHLVWRELLKKIANSSPVDFEPLTAHEATRELLFCDFKAEGLS